MSGRSFRRRIRALLLPAVLWCGLPDGAFARDRLAVGFSALTMSTIMPHVAQDLGYFDQEDLDVTLRHFESGPTAVKALLARAVDVSEAETSTVLNADANGADLRIIGTHEWGLHFILYARRGVNSLEDLYGKRFATSGPGGMAQLVITALLDAKNLDADRLRMVPIGGQDSRLKALLAGKVDATLGERSDEIEADPQLHELFAARDELPRYLASVLAAHPDTLANKAPAIEKFQRALLKATRFAYSHKKEFVKLASKYLPGDAGKLGRDYDFYSKVRHWSVNGEVPVDRVEYMQTLGLRTKMQPRTLDIKKIVDDRITDRVLLMLGRVEFAR